jgi:hypothetical protein
MFVAPTGRDAVPRAGGEVATLRSSVCSQPKTNMPALAMQTATIL